MSKIIIGITGGIAAYKTLDVIRLLVKQDHEVRTILTRNATEFVTPLSVETLSLHPAAVEMFGARAADAIEHIELGIWADVAAVAPATANFLGKMANGIADDLLTTTLLALQPGTPLVLAPAMNTRMWNHPAVQRNLQTVRQDLGDNLHLVAPQEKLLACGEWGVGAMAEPAEIAELITSLLPAP
jgi:phosphopantothenoylcysteine decarboxylase / phosphopantothenate---cysteine ligase